MKKLYGSTYLRPESPIREVVSFQPSGPNSGETSPLRAWPERRDEVSNDPPYIEYEATEQDVTLQSMLEGYVYVNPG
jgi:hypothetical protein